MSVVFHDLQEGDTLVALALKYDTTEGAIARANGLITGDLDYLPLKNKVTGCATRLVIPDAVEDVLIKEDPVATQRRVDELQASRRCLAVRAFQEAAQRKFPEEAPLHAAEVEFYLSEHQWSVPEAMKAYVADIQWERSQPATGLRQKLR